MTEIWGLDILRDMYMKCRNCGQCHRTLELNGRDIKCQNEKSDRRTDINAGNQPAYESSPRYKHTRSDEGKVKQTLLTLYD
jgi:hypothetical protein